MCTLRADIRRGWRTAVGDDISAFATTSAWLTARVRAGYPSVRRAAAALGVDRGALASYMDGIKVPPDAFLRHFARDFGDPAEQVLALAHRSRRPPPAEGDPFETVREVLADDDGRVPDHDVAAVLAFARVLKEERARYTPGARPPR